MGSLYGYDAAVEHGNSLMSSISDYNQGVVLNHLKVADEIANASKNYQDQLRNLGSQFIVDKAIEGVEGVTGAGALASGLKNYYKAGKEFGGVADFSRPSVQAAIGKSRLFGVGKAPTSYQDFLGQRADEAAAKEAARVSGATELGETPRLSAIQRIRQAGSSMLDLAAERNPAIAQLRQGVNSITQSAATGLEESLRGGVNSAVGDLQNSALSAVSRARQEAQGAAQGALRSAASSALDSVNPANTLGSVADATVRPEASETLRRFPGNAPSAVGEPEGVEMTEFSPTRTAAEARPPTSLPTARPVPETPAFAGTSLQDLTADTLTPDASVPYKEAHYVSNLFDNPQVESDAFNSLPSRLRFNTIAKQNPGKTVMTVRSNMGGGISTRVYDGENLTPEDVGLDRSQVAQSSNPDVPDQDGPLFEGEDNRVDQVASSSLDRPSPASVGEAADTASAAEPVGAPAPVVSDEPATTSADQLEARQQFLRQSQATAPQEPFQRPETTPPQAQTQQKEDEVSPAEPAEPAPQPISGEPTPPTPGQAEAAAEGTEGEVSPEGFIKQQAKTIGGVGEETANNMGHYGGKLLASAGGILAGGQDIINAIHGSKGWNAIAGDNWEDKVGNIGTMAGTALDLAGAAVPILEPVGAAIGLISGIFGDIGEKKDEEAAKAKIKPAKPSDPLLSFKAAPEVAQEGLVAKPIASEA